MAKKKPKVKVSKKKSTRKRKKISIATIVAAPILAIGSLVAFFYGNDIKKQFEPKKKLTFGAVCCYILL